MGLIKLLNKNEINMDANSRTYLDMIIALGNRRILKGKIEDNIVELYSKHNKLLGRLEIPNSETAEMLKCAYSKSDREKDFHIPIVAKPNDEVYFTYIKFNKEKNTIEVENMHVGILLYLEGECVGPDNYKVAAHIYDMFEQTLADFIPQEFVFTSPEEFIKFKNKFHNMSCDKKDTTYSDKPETLKLMRKSRRYKYKAICGYKYNSVGYVSTIDNEYEGDLETKSYKITFDTRFDYALAHSIGDFCIDGTSDFLKHIREIRIDSYSNGVVNISNAEGKPIVLKSGAFRSSFDIEDKDYKEPF